jgi:hypothetical protein
MSNRITRLFCSNNKITSFKYLPDSINKLDCGDNPCYVIYEELGLDGIHKHNNILEIKEPR